MGLLSKLVELGERHFDRKANEDLLQYFCPAYVEALAKKGQWKKKTIEAWEVFFEFIKGAMLHGLKKKQSHASPPHSTNDHHRNLSFSHTSSAPVELGDQQQRESEQNPDNKKQLENQKHLDNQQKQLEKQLKQLENQQKHLDNQQQQTKCPH